jgi:hypothetical protein
VLHLQKIVGCPLDVLSNLMAMRWTVEQRTQNEHVERTLQKIGARFVGLAGRRHSTLDGMS